jgi:ribosome biogenesis protein ERB1
MENEFDFGGLASNSFKEHNALAYLSDSSDEEEGTLLRIGRVPREWYDDLDHLGYNIDGKPIARKTSGASDRIDQFLKKHDGSIYSIYDPDNDRDVQLSKEEIAMIRRIRKGQFGHSDFNNEDEKYFVDVPKVIHPIGNVMIPSKARFIPSKWENKKILKILQAIRNGWIHPDKSDKQKEEQESVFLMWNENGDASNETQSNNGLQFVPATKSELPGHSESYNPPEEYILSEKEREEWEQMDEEDRDSNFIPQKFDSLRKVAAYENFLQERFQRCLDLYLCTRKIKNKLNIDPESLIPKLPDPSSLRPFPCKLAIVYSGHQGRIRSISVSPCGEWLASGSEDRSLCIWEVETGRLFKKFEFDDTVKKVSWNPVKGRPLVACIVSDRLVIIPVLVGTKEQNTDINAFMIQLKGLISHRKLSSEEESCEGDGSKSNSSCVADWQIEDYNAGLYVVQKLTVTQGGLLTSFSWHNKGDYFVTTRSDSVKLSVVIHRLSQAQSQTPFGKNKGHVQAACFHPTKPLFFVASKTYVKMYDLASQSFVKKIVTPIKWISSMDVHPSGDHIILGGYDRRVCWFDLDMSTQPYKNLKYHLKGVRKVQFHKRYPLFASCSDDGKVHIFHGKVYSDLMESPTIVPVKILRAHEPKEDLGVLDICYHPSQPWVFSAGADGLVKLFNQ